MRRVLMLSAMVVCFAEQALALDHSHKAWSGILSRYLDANGFVNYAGLKADVQSNENHAFAKYLRDLQVVTFANYQSFSKDQRKAFLINAYNAFTLKLIIDHYPVKSIRKIGGIFTKPWSVEFFTLLDGKIKSLDPIEHEWLRPKFKDYRIHAAVNCASISCPALRREAFVASKLDAQLDEQMRVWLADATRNRIDAKKGEYRLSKIFDWYEKDFVKWGGGVAAVVKKYLPPAQGRQVAAEIDIDYLDYDWGLNKIRKR